MFALLKISAEISLYKLGKTARGNRKKGNRKSTKIPTFIPFLTRCQFKNRGLSKFLSINM
jgi:hypothetical protein